MAGRSEPSNGLEPFGRLLRGAGIFSPDQVRVLRSGSTATGLPETTQSPAKDDVSSIE